MDRTVACEHAEACPGCPLIALPYSAQLEVKRGKVLGALARYPDLRAVAVHATRAADPIEGYRARAKLVVGGGGRVGLYARGRGHDVVDLPGCRVLAPVIALVAGAVRARALRDEATGGALAPCGPGSTGSLRAIDLREVRPPDGSPPRVLLTLVVDRSREFKLEAARDAARELADEIPAILGVGVNFHDGEHAHVLGSETIRVVGEGSALDRSGMATQRAGFGAFTQAHRGQAEAMHDLVFETFSAGATPGAPLRVLDLYGGSGAFAIGLASRFARAATGGSPGVDVVMVESFAPAAEAARADAARQGLPVTVLASDATKALESLSRRRQGFQAAVVNPPRRGVPPAARLGLARLAPAVVAYVSCDPDTLARDLDHLARLGLRAEEIHPFDMIPLSEHVEAVAILRGHEPPPPRELYADADVVAFDKPPHEPTTPQGEHVGSLTDRVRRCIGPEAVPIHRLDVGTSGVVFFARTPSRVAPFSRALGAASARKVYLVATRGVLRLVRQAA